MTALDSTPRDLHAVLPHSGPLPDAGIDPDFDGDPGDFGWHFAGRRPDADHF